MLDLTRNQKIVIVTALGHNLMRIVGSPLPPAGPEREFVKNELLPYMEKALPDSLTGERPAVDVLIETMRIVMAATEEEEA